MGESTARRRESMSDQALIEGTGVDWKTWLEILDDREAATMDHKSIADLLVKEFGVDGWWAQSITVGYEQERGMREPGQRADGTYAASASKTVPVEMSTAFEWVADPDLRQRWIGDLELTQRTAAPPKSVRFDASDGTLVAVSFAAGPGAKSSVSVEAGKLSSAGEAASVKSAWKERLARLAAALTH